VEDIAPPGSAVAESPRPELPHPKDSSQEASSSRSSPVAEKRAADVPTSRSSGDFKPAAGFQEVPPILGSTASGKDFLAVEDIAPPGSAVAESPRPDLPHPKDSSQVVPDATFSTDDASEKQRLASRQETSSTQTTLASRDWEPSALVPCAPVFEEAEAFRNHDEVTAACKDRASPTEQQDLGMDKLLHASVGATFAFATPAKTINRVTVSL